MIKILEYDSNLFNYYVAELNLINEINFETLKRELVDKQIKLLYIYPQNESTKIQLEAQNFKPIDTKVVFEKPVENNNINSNILVQSYSERKYHTELFQLAKMSGKYSRFRTDCNFTNNEFEKLYYDWINKSIMKQIADDVLINEIENKIAGFITYKINNEALTIGLIAVNETSRKMGIGKSLLEKVNNIAYLNGIKKINVATQFENTTAMCFYKKNGFAVIKKQEVYHLWV